MGSSTLTPRVATPPLLNLKVSGWLSVVTGGMKAMAHYASPEGCIAGSRLVSSFFSLPPRAVLQRTTLNFSLLGFRGPLNSHLRAGSPRGPPEKAKNWVLDPVQKGAFPLHKFR